MKYRNITLKILSMALIGCLSFVPMVVLANPTDENTESNLEETVEEVIELPEDAIILSTAEDVLMLAEKCVLNTWSVDKVVALNNDIDMSDVEFEGIPSFGGTFLGQGHKITGLYIEHDASVVGFFRYLQKTAEVENLHIEAQILPEGTAKMVGGFVGNNAGTINNCSFVGEVSGKELIGGIVGYNRASGIVENCTTAGFVHGNHLIGGVAGKNEGVVRFCTNEANVNTKSEENSVSLDIANLSLESLATYESIDNSTEIGGIAGKSSGVIRECYNKANVGYKKMGYNVGGIVGTQNGYVVDCINYADVQGANGVGGIAGQFMPSIVLEFGPDPMETMNSKLNSMMNSVEELTNEMSEMTSGVSYDTSSMSSDMSTMEDAMGSLEDSVNPESGEVDEDAINAAVGSLSNALGNSSNELSNMQSSIDTSGVTESMDKVMNDMNGIKDAMSTMTAGFEMNDISRKDRENDTIGKIANSTNYGNISGATAVGGIAGMLDVEYNTGEEDVEVSGEMTSNGEGTIRLVVRDCKNYGTIAASKKYAGGIAGQMVVGAIFDCKNIGNLDALNANYVGGIAGSCETVIFDSYSKSVMAGSNYVGGIAGYAVEVVDSCAFVDIAASEEYTGAIVGSTDVLPREEDDLIVGNIYFLNGTDIGGIDGVSYEGATDRIELEDFLAIEELDDMYKTVDVRFVADEQEDVVFTINVGETIAYEDIPILTVAETDMYDWVLKNPVTHEVLAMGEEEKIIYASDARLSNILFDQTYEADFERKNTVTQGEEKTADNKSTVLAVGAFEKNTRVELKDVLVKETIVCGDEVFENWEVLISNRGIEKLHYRIPEGKEAKALVLYVKSTTGTWEERDFMVEGSYIVFDFEAENSGFALAEKFVLNTTLVVGVVAVVILVGIVLFVKKKKGMTKNFQKKETEKTVEVQE